MAISSSSIASSSTLNTLRTEFNKRGRDNPYLLDEDLIEDKYYAFRGAEWLEHNW